MRWHGIISRRGGRHYPGQTAGYRVQDDTPEPMEQEGDVIWVDEYLGLVAMKHGDMRMYLSMNWKGHWRTHFDPEAPYEAEDLGWGVSGVARLHYTTDSIDRIGTIEMRAPYGWRRLYEVDYGDYLIRMNLSELHTYPVEIEGHSMGVDLVSEKEYDLGEKLALPPLTAKIIYVGP